MMNSSFELTLNVSLREVSGYGGQLNISESLQLKADNFFELCEILGEFHKLAEALKAAHEINGS